MGHPADNPAKLAFTVGVIGLALVNLWFADSAMTFQYQLLEGCWPSSVVVDGTSLLPESLVSSAADQRGLAGIERFYFTRLNHRVLFYLVILAAAIGWGGSVLLGYVRREQGSEESPILPTWTTMLAALLLAVLAGGIVFLLLISGRLVVDPGGDRCISEGYAYLSTLAGLAAGMFVVSFFKWFESIAQSLWSRVSGSSAGGE